MRFPLAGTASSEGTSCSHCTQHWPPGWTYWQLGRHQIPKNSHACQPDASCVRHCTGWPRSTYTVFAVAFTMRKLLGVPREAPASPVPGTAPSALPPVAPTGQVPSEVSHFTHCALWATASIRSSMVINTVGAHAFSSSTM